MECGARDQIFQVETFTLPRPRCIVDKLLRNDSDPHPTVHFDNILRLFAIELFEKGIQLHER